MKPDQFLCYMFLFSISFVCVDLDRVQKKGIEMYMGNQPTHLGWRKLKQSARSGLFKIKKATLYTPFWVCWASQPVTSISFV